LELAHNRDRHDMVTWLERQGVAGPSRTALNEKASLARTIVKQNRWAYLVMLINSSFPRLPADSIEEQKHLLEMRWLAADMDDKLAHVWRQHHSVDTLRELHDKHLGSATDEALGAMARAAAKAIDYFGPSVDLTAEQEALLPRVRTVAKEIYSNATPTRLESTCRFIAQAINVGQVEAAERFVTSRLGRAILTGNEAKRAEESTLVTRFSLGLPVSDL
jgi:hypothetical protein